MHGRAFDLITGAEAQRAFDIRREPDSLRERYGRNGIGQRLLLARRLVEAGVPFVHVRTFDWDDHATIEARMKARCPMYDQGMVALIEDLHERIVKLGARIHMYQPEAMDMETAFMKLTEGKTA